MSLTGWFFTPLGETAEIQAKWHSTNQIIKRFPRVCEAQEDAEPEVQTQVCTQHPAQDPNFLISR